MFFLVTQVLSQTHDFDIEEHIGKIISRGDEVENQQFYNLLLHFYDNPIDLNDASYQQFEQLGLLSQRQIEEILKHRTKSESFKSINELQVLDFFTLEDIKELIPFITVGIHHSLTDIALGLIKSKNNYATLGYSRVIELSKGYKENIYQGSPDRLQMRIRIRNPGHLSFGLTAQKDPGENWLTKDALPRPDYVSGHIYLENQGRIKQLVFGDYRLQYGQGLVLGAGFMVGKNIESVASIKQSTLGVLPYTSITENKFFRGSGLMLNLSKHINVSMFYSNQHLDATVINNSVLPSVSSIRQSGLHRTDAEIAASNQLGEQVWGSVVTYNSTNWSSGVLIVNTQFNQPIVPQTRDYNKFSFSGKELLNYSWFGQYSMGNFLIFSELAKTHNAGVGVNIGFIGTVSKYTSISMLYRLLQKDFHSFYGAPFSERSSIGNENGLYWGIKIYPLPKLTFSAYYDMYRFDWITSRTAAPANGMDYLLRLDYELNEQVKLFIQVRTEQSQLKEMKTNLSVNHSVKLLKTILNFDYNLESPLTFRTRVQFNKFNGINSEGGWLLYQDINYKTWKFNMSGRILVFDTESFKSRQYVYEKDMLFTFNTRLYQGKGVSYFIIVMVKPFRNLSFRAKWSYTEYVNQSVIGSGNDIIPGNHKTQLTGQLYYKF